MQRFVALLVIALSPACADALAQPFSFSDPAFNGGAAPPTNVAISSPNSGNAYDNLVTSVTVSGTYDGAATGCTWKINAGSETACGTCAAGSFSCSVTGLSSTVLNTVTVKVSNAGGNATDTQAHYGPPPGSPSLWFAAWNIDGNRNAGVSHGADVATWEDLGSLGKDAAQSDDTKRPRSQLPCSSGWINDRPCVDFNTSGDYMETAVLDATLAQPNLICVVAQPSNTTTSECIVDGNATAREAIFFVFGGDDVGYVAGGTNQIGGNPDAFTFNMICGTFNGASSSLRQDGAVVSTGNPGSEGLAQLFLGQNYPLACPLTGSIAEVLVYDTVPTVADVEAYFEVRYGDLPDTL